jgi:hypothetical protein
MLKPTIQQLYDRFAIVKDGRHNFNVKPADRWVSTIHIKSSGHYPVLPEIGHRRSLQEFIDCNMGPQRIFIGKIYNEEELELNK